MYTLFIDVNGGIGVPIQLYAVNMGQKYVAMNGASVLVR